MLVFCSSLELSFPSLSLFQLFSFKWAHMRELFDTVSIFLFRTINIKCSHYILWFPSTSVKLCHARRQSGALTHPRAYSSRTGVPCLALCLQLLAWCWSHCIQMIKPAEMGCEKKLWIWGNRICKGHLETTNVTHFMKLRNKMEGLCKNSS